MHDLILILGSAAVSAVSTHFYKKHTAPTAESIAEKYAAARAKVKSTIDGAEALAEKLKASL